MENRAIVKTDKTKKQTNTTVVKTDMNSFTPTKLKSNKDTTPDSNTIYTNFADLNHAKLRDTFRNSNFKNETIEDLNKKK